MTRIWGDVRDAESNHNGSALVCFLIVKLAAPVSEFANRGWTEAAARRVGEIDIPLVSLGIVETEGEDFEVACRAVGLTRP